MRFLRYFLSWFSGFVQCPYIAEDKMRRGMSIFLYCRKKKHHLGEHTDFTAGARSEAARWKRSSR